MVPSAEDVLIFAVAFAVPCIIIFALMPPYIRFLTARGSVTNDAAKTDGKKVPTPAGPLLMLAVVFGEGCIYLLNGSSIPLAAIAVVLVAGVVGFYDDFRGLGGIANPVLMMLAAAPLIFLEGIHESLYSAVLYFPLFGATGTHYIIFAILIVAAMPVSSHAFNMLDSFNGELSGFATLTSVALIVAILFSGLSFSSYDYIRLAAVLPLTATALCFYFFNRFPSRAFDGNSGSLMLGALFAALAIMGGVEIAALVAVIPAVINSYYTLYSVRGLVEHKRMTARPTYLGEDGKLHASSQPGAPATLVRMVLAGGPMGEKELVRNILLLTAFACLLSVLTSAMTWFT